MERIYANFAWARKKLVLKQQVHNWSMLLPSDSLRGKPLLFWKASTTKIKDAGSQNDKLLLCYADFQEPWWFADYYIYRKTSQILLHHNLRWFPSANVINRAKIKGLFYERSTAWMDQSEARKYFRASGISQTKVLEGWIFTYFMQRVKPYGLIVETYSWTEIVGIDQQNGLTKNV